MSEGQNKGLRVRLLLFGCAVSAFAALAAAQFGARSVRLIYNASDSVPEGWYRVDPAGTLHVGSLVLARLPDDTADFAARRRYLPLGVPLLKPVAALPPSEVCMNRQLLSIDRHPAAIALVTDSRDRPLRAWPGCGVLAGDQLFLLSRSAESFDSRYFGPVSTADVIGVAQPLWIWSER